MSNIAEALRMSGSQWVCVRKVRRMLGQPVVAFAAVLGVHRNSLAHPLSHKMQRALRDVVRVLDWFADAVGEDAAAFWFVNWPIPEFGYCTAMALFSTGRRSDLLQAIETSRIPTFRTFTARKVHS